MIDLLKQNGYTFADYMNYDNYDKCVILRHDIDNSVTKALQMAKLEASLGVKSTFFVLLATKFYNIAERDCRDSLLEIKRLGHDIGLHFDELNYPNRIDVEEQIIKETGIMGSILGFPIESVSMHRPSKHTLEADYKLDGKIVNSYGQKYFKGFKYVSDSRRRWREDVISIIRSCEYPKLHILTHAFWYNESELSIEDSVREFVLNGNIERYNAMSENITDLESIMPRMIL